MSEVLKFRRIDPDLFVLHDRVNCFVRNAPDADRFAAPACGAS